MNQATKRRIELAALDAGWDDPFPQKDRQTGGFYWNGKPYSKHPDNAWCESFSAKTEARCYELAARLLNLKVKGK